MKCEGDEKEGMEGGFRAAPISFETFAVLTPTFITTDYTNSHTTFLWKESLTKETGF